MALKLSVLLLLALTTPSQSNATGPFRNYVRNLGGKFEDEGAVTASVLCARALAVLAASGLDYNNTGFPQLNPVILSSMDDAETRFAGATINVEPNKALGGVNRSALMGSLLSGYESYSLTAFSSSGRVYAAWLLGEWVRGEAEPLILRNLAAEKSPIARGMYSIALARLGNSDHQAEWARTAQRGRAVFQFNHWRQKLSFPLIPQQRFSFSLSTDNTGILALAFLKTLGPDTENLLLKRLLGILSDVQPYSMWGNMRRFVPPENVRLNSWANPDEGTLDALIFTLSRHRSVRAFQVINEYFRSISHYGSASGPPAELSSNSFLHDPVSTAFTSEELFPHSPDWASRYQHHPNINLLIASMYHLDPEQTLETVTTKLRELNFFLSSGDYSTGSRIWNCLYTDRKIWSAAYHYFSRNDYGRLEQMAPRIKYKTHGD